jgi:16S rRNA (guanine966-N2)-methyltransferase
MRVIAGEKGGRRLLAPPGRQTRPTSDRVREATFSMLSSLGVLEEALVWDLFAGSGAMGIEALSRGAAHATFVEQAQSACSATRANLAALGYGPGRATVICGDVLAWVASQTGTPVRRRGQPPSVRRPVRSEAEGPVKTATAGDHVVDLVTADPPYAWQGWGSLLDSLARFRPLLVAETGNDLALPVGWRALRSKRYGGTVVTLARQSDSDERPGPGVDRDH